MPTRPSAAYQRRSAPKSRTGCRSCRKRKLKCDEEKPACNRCSRAGIRCEGFMYMGTTGNTLQSHQLPGSNFEDRRLSPKQPDKNDAKQEQLSRLQLKKAIWHSETLDRVPHRNTTVLWHANYSMVNSSRTQRTRLFLAMGKDAYSDHFATLYRQPNRSLCGNDEEYRYFRFYSDRTASSLAGCYNTSVWDQSVLQACERESSIFHAAIAIAALDLSFKSNHPSPEKGSGIERHRAKEHYSFALRQYSMAIKQMRNAITNGDGDMTSVLISSMLMIAFETYHGHRELAIAQIKSSVQLLENWTGNDLQGASRTSVSSPPGVVDDDLIQAFSRLQVEALVYSDDMSVKNHAVQKDGYTAMVDMMPLMFETAHEARRFGGLIMCRIFHFLCMAWSYDPEIRSPPDTSLHFMDRIKCRANAQNCAEQDKYNKELDRWELAFAPLLERDSDKVPKGEHLQVACQRLHYLGVRVILTSFLREDEMFFDTLTPIFTEIISIAQKVLCDLDNSAFTFDAQVIVPLGMVAGKCRDPIIRREAIRLLLTRYWRELFLDGVLLAKIYTWIMNVEEEGLVGGLVPEEARARNVIIKPGRQKATAYVSCQFPKIGGQLGDTLVRETIIT